MSNRMIVYLCNRRGIRTSSCFSHQASIQSLTSRARSLKLTNRAACSCGKSLVCNRVQNTRKQTLVKAVAVHTLLLHTHPAARLPVSRATRESCSIVAPWRLHPMACSHVARFVGTQLDYIMQKTYISHGTGSAGAVLNRSPQRRSYPAAGAPINLTL